MSVTPSRPRSPRKVLVVEDEAIVALELSERLRGAGFEVCGCADSAGEAVAMALDARPDIILMDVVLKGQDDGIHAAARIGQFLQVPIIYLTAFSDPSTVHRAALTGPYGYLTKPYQAKELLAAIEVALYKASLEQRLKASERWFSSTLRCVGDAVLAIDLDGTVKFANPAAERLLGRSIDAASAAQVGDLLVYDGDAMSGPLQVHHAEVRSNRRLRGAKGVTSVDESVAPIRDEQGAIMGWVLALRDVSARVAAEQILRESEERFRTAFDLAPVGMALIAVDGSFLQANAALCGLLDATADELAQGALHQFLLPEDADAEAARLRLLGASHGQPFTQYELRFRSRQGRLFWGAVSASCLERHDQSVCYLYQVMDITERKLDEGRLARQAHFDALTGLPNRASFTVEFERQLRVSERTGQPLALLMIDLDDFKPVNDRHGHAVGDELLVAAARRMRDTLRAGDVVFRWGGDEFAVLLPGIQGADQAWQVAGKLVQAFESPFPLNMATARIGLSIGVALYPADGDSGSAILAQADAALYRVKNQGKSGVRLADAAVQAEVELRRGSERANQRDFDVGHWSLAARPVRQGRTGTPVAVLLGLDPQPGFRLDTAADEPLVLSTLAPEQVCTALQALRRDWHAHAERALLLPLWWPFSARSLRDANVLAQLQELASQAPDLAARLVLMLPALRGVRAGTPGHEDLLPQVLPHVGGYVAMGLDPAAADLATLVAHPPAALWVNDMGTTPHGHPALPAWRALARGAGVPLVTWCHSTLWQHATPDEREGWLCVAMPGAPSAADGPASVSPRTNS